jgi:hypothetical protein
MLVLGNIPVIEGIDAKVKYYLKNVRKVEQSPVKAIFLVSNCILNCPVDAEQPKRFDQQVKQ